MRSVFFGSIFFSLLISGCGAKPISSYTSENTKINPDVQTHAIDSIAMPYRDQMHAEMEEVIGDSDSTLLSYAPESPLGNFVADVIFETGFEYAKTNLICSDSNDIFSILNFGGLRRPIKKGPITRGDIYELMPFDNSIVILKISHVKFFEMLDYLYSVNGQPVSNIHLELSENAKGVTVGPDGDNNPEFVYVITSDYLSGGGDKMDFLKEPIQIWNTGILIRDALINYIQIKKQIPFYPTEERILFN